MRLTFDRAVGGLRATVTIDRDGGKVETLELLPVSGKPLAFESTVAPEEPHEFSAQLKLTAISGDDLPAASCPQAESQSDFRDADNEVRGRVCHSGRGRNANGHDHSRGRGLAIPPSFLDVPSEGFRWPCTLLLRGTSLQICAWTFRYFLSRRFWLGNGQAHWHRTHHSNPSMLLACTKQGAGPGMRRTSRSGSGHRLAGRRRHGARHGTRHGPLASRRRLPMTCDVRLCQVFGT